MIVVIQGLIFKITVASLDSRHITSERKKYKHTGCIWPIVSSVTGHHRRHKTQRNTPPVCSVFAYISSTWDPPGGSGCTLQTSHSCTQWLQEVIISSLSLFLCTRAPLLRSAAADGVTVTCLQEQAPP